MLPLFISTIIPWRAREGLAPRASEVPDRGMLPGGLGCVSSLGAAQTTFFIANNPLQKKNNPTNNKKTLALQFWAFPLFLSRSVPCFALVLFSSLEQKLNSGR